MAALRPDTPRPTTITSAAIVLAIEPVQLYKVLLGVIDFDGVEIQQ